MRLFSRHLVFAALCLTLALSQASFGSTFTTFDVPGAVGIIPTSVNKWGSVTGYYSPSTGNGYNGFVYQASTGTITVFHVPGVSRTYPTSINDTGWVVGYYSNPNRSEVLHGFLRNPQITILDAPGAGTLAGQGTQALSINDAGEISGVYIDASYVQHGFIRDASGNYATFDIPGDSSVVSAWLNQGGQVGGGYNTFDSVNGNIPHGYIMGTDGTFTTFDVPGNTYGTYVAGINASGEITGSYFPTINPQEFVRDQFGNITTFSITGYETTAGIEDNGNIIGMYKTGSAFRGWKRTAAGVISFFNDPNAGPGGTFPTCASGNAKVAGSYADSSGKIHGFLMVN